VIEMQVLDEKELLPVSLESEHAYLGLHSIDVFVRNQERSLRFYLDQLGFELAFDVRLQSRERWVAVSPPNGSAVLRLIQPEPNTAEYKLIGRATRIAFVTENVAATFREWSARGVRFRHTPRLRRIKYQQHSLSETHTDPLIHHGEQTPIWGQVFTRFEDIDRNSFALVSFDEVSKAIEVQRRARVQKLEAERRAAHELEVARQVQVRLFPQVLPECSTLEYAGICAQARQVGGDYYDFLVLGPERLGLVIGDVAGKGIAAALLMANLQAHLRSQCLMAVDQPGKLLTSVNRLFYENTPSSSYATLLFAEYDNKTQRLRYINCGHLSGLLLRSDDSVNRLESTCTVLGLFADWVCSVAECRIGAGDVLALYTDGATESFNDADEEFGESGILSSLKRNRDQSPPEIAKTILTDVQGFAAGEQHDDITLIVAKYRTGLAGKK
jgi:serine phosphatase RsbU (regulator of sigma subunit)